MTTATAAKQTTEERMAAFAEDFKFLVDEGCSRQEIAKRMGISVTTIEKRAQDLRLWYPDRSLREVNERFLELLEIGEPFSVLDFPIRVGFTNVSRLLNSAKAYGMVKVAGYVPSPALLKGTKMPMYTAP